MTKHDFDAVVMGLGPNGLSTAITSQHAGLSVLLLERYRSIRGGMLSAVLTFLGFVHDTCLAVHPMEKSLLGLTILKNGKLHIGRLVFVFHKYTSVFLDAPNDYRIKVVPPF